MRDDVIFETARLRGRRLDADDLPAMLAVYGDASAMRWVGNGEPLTESQCRHWIAITEKNYRERGYGMFALAERGSGAVIGFCGLVHPGGQVEPEIKYALKREGWGMGYATEAVRALLAWGAEAKQLRHIIATVDPDHHASQNVLQKAGMQRGALRRNDDGSFTQMFNWTPSC